MARMNRPAPVEVTDKNVRFLIIHNPTNATFNKCIHVLDWPFDDGAPPSNQIVHDWLSPIEIKFREEPGGCIAVHCVAGLGRAPVIVALSLTEGRMKYGDAVQFIRQRRCVNSKQPLYLEKYHPNMQLRFKDSNGHRNNCRIQ
ncbi:protein tyrosine phosphatase type IVA 1-like isoform X2 [Marmota monax]|uniref:protein tyrosine phosphatase type IVA 1-like isoform X2 n=1 Tax=Marmota monax TaxID=9995 RepID=UPI0026EC57EA|nr:protein tyrosine phosphatase type IVA 1-like isoform X2 [Marmota monax]